ncbi:SDR family oxidoreductase [Hazenella sp. IB182357]|uniref:SDR family oxidoreductase n=1 Tax=Polycladospora coralii TaxID=2771432 RepID=A0A926NHU6_9BACL|nr:SDR family oxidoreductase [Polycladospora coralii]
MNVLVIGANGKIGRMVSAFLAEKNDVVHAMIRDKNQAKYFHELGIDTIVADLEKDFSHACEGMDAIIFTAGSGAHTGPDKTLLIDRDGAIKAIDEATKRGINRFVLVSSLRAEQPEAGPESLQLYLQAKRDADIHLQASSLDYTIIRPGTLSDDSGTGKVSIADHLAYQPQPIPRIDVAHTIVETLKQKNTYRRTFDLLPGNQTISDALNRLE